MDGCMFNVVLRHVLKQCRPVDGWLYVQSCFKALQMGGCTCSMDGCMFKVVLKHCTAGLYLDGWLYVQSCFKALQASRWMVVCSMDGCMFKVVLTHCRTVNG